MLSGEDMIAWTVGCGPRVALRPEPARNQTSPPASAAGVTRVPRSGVADGWKRTKQFFDPAEESWRRPSWSCARRRAPFGVAQTSKPLRVTEPSVCHVIVSPELMLTPFGPLVPRYVLPPSVSLSQQLSVLKLLEVIVTATVARMVHRSLFP